MWYSSVSFILAITVGIQSLPGVLLATISFNSKNHMENVDLFFIEPMDKCDDPNNRNGVRLNNMSLTFVREDFVKSLDVRFITLENNMIKDISVDAFRSVPNLMCLNIRKNYINEHFLRTFRHDNLEKLNLANNIIQLADYMEWNVSLPRLTHLDISNNGITWLPSQEIFQSSFPSLTHFYSFGNLFIPLSSSLPLSVEHVYLERNINQISLYDIPDNLSTLDINGNMLYEFDICKFPKLKILYMSKCVNVASIMNYIKIFPNLVQLDLSSNDLTSIPPSWFNNIGSLQRLSLKNNSLYEFPFLNELTLLTDLSLNFNKITNIEVGSIADHVYLERLYLRGNRISLIKKDAFSKFRYLETLDLADNRLTMLPSSWILPLTALSHLDLSMNLFGTIDDMSLNVFTKSLKHLYLGENNFTRIELSSIDKLNSNVNIHIF